MGFELLFLALGSIFSVCCFMLPVVLWAFWSHAQNVHLLAKARQMSAVKLLGFSEGDVEHPLHLELSVRGERADVALVVEAGVPLWMVSVPLDVAWSEVAVVRRGHQKTGALRRLSPVVDDAFLRHDVFGDGGALSALVEAGGRRLFAFPWLRVVDIRLMEGELQVRAVRKGVELEAVLDLVTIATRVACRLDDRPKRPWVSYVLPPSVVCSTSPVASFSTSTPLQPEEP